jgi:hypothetical protein
VCPERFIMQDKVSICYPEALHIEKMRNLFIEQVEDIFRKRVLKTSV